MQYSPDLEACNYSYINNFLLQHSLIDLLQ